MERDFIAECSDQRWVADISEFRCRDWNGVGWGLAGVAAGVVGVVTAVLRDRYGFIAYIGWFDITVGLLLALLSLRRRQPNLRVRS